MLSDEDAGRLADRLLAFWMEGDDDRSSAAIDRLADVFWRTPLVPEHDVDRIVDQGHYRALAPDQVWALSTRQIEVLQGLADGKRDDEIAFQMGIAEKSVNKHAQRATIRLRCRTRTEAVGVAVACGIVTSTIRESLKGDRLNVRSLTPRLAVTLRLVALGKTNNEIADEMGVAIDTAKNYVDRLLDILGARNRAHLVTIAFGTGRLSFSDSRHTD